MLVDGGHRLGSGRQDVPHLLLLGRGQHRPQLAHVVHDLALGHSALIAGGLGPLGGCLRVEAQRHPPSEQAHLPSGATLCGMRQGSCLQHRPVLR